MALANISPVPSDEDGDDQRPQFSSDASQQEEEEEDDYMSEDFLQQCLPAAQTAPGLLKTQKAKREHEILKRREEQQEEERARKRQRKSLKEIETEQREVGLATQLDSSNRGFAMLARMGYTPGTGLGRQDAPGRLEPVAVVVKEGKAGLGRESALREIAEEKCRKLEQRARQLVDQFDPAAFRQQMREKHAARRAESDLFKAQKSCRDLDERKGFYEPAESWLWPKIEKPPAGPDAEEDEEEEEEEIFTVVEKLRLILTYLRATHLYCLYCGTSYDSQEDLAASCPGPGRDDHDD